MIDLRPSLRPTLLAVRGTSDFQNNYSSLYTALQKITSTDPKKQEEEIKAALQGNSAAFIRLYKALFDAKEPQSISIHELLKPENIQRYRHDPLSQ